MAIYVPLGAVEVAGACTDDDDWPGAGAWARTPAHTTKAATAARETERLTGKRITSKLTGPRRGGTTRRAVFRFVRDRRSPLERHGEYRLRGRANRVSLYAHSTRGKKLR